MNPMLLEWCFAREVVRRLGFTPDEIFFGCAPNGIVVENGKSRHFKQPVIAVELRRGGLTFIWTIGPIDLPVEEIQPAFEAACAAWNAGDVASMDDFKKSRPFLQAVPLMLALQRKGFAIRSPGDNN
jgi:hypothetical protein